MNAHPQFGETLALYAMGALDDAQDLAALDLSYAPPFAPVYDPVLAAAIKAADGAGRPAASTLGGSP
jgi:hypothetical protein